VTARAGSLKPVPKVAAGTAAGALAVVVVWVLHTVWHVELPPEVIAAVTVLLTAGTAYLR
jgi:hypothetical protein